LSWLLVGAIVWLAAAGVLHTAAVRASFSAAEPIDGVLVYR
jgi:hypothetical protein